MSDRGAAVAETRLPGTDREVLTRWAQGGAGESSRRAVRARIVLACAEPGAADAQVAATLGVSRATVTCWRRRYAEGGPAGLADAVRSGRPKAVLELSSAERAQLTRWTRQVSTGPRLALRAKIVLACAAGASNTDTAVRLHVTEATVARWRQRFLAGRLDGLADRPRPGRPPTIPPQRIRQVIAATWQRPPRHAARWSRASMAQESGLSASTIGRIWSRSGLRPHLAGEPAFLADMQQKKLPSMISGARHSADAPPSGGPGPEGDQANPRGGTLLAAERRDVLLARLRRDGKLIAKDLAAELGLSDDSIRRDLRDLAAAGQCQRVYGGALPVSPATGPHTSRSGIAPDSKRRVAARAAQLIVPGMTVILDGGTTALEVVAALPPDLDATIVTHSATTAAALASHPTVDVYMLSGQLHKQSVNASGATAAEAAVGITADLALLTIPGVHAHEGLTATVPEDAAMKRILARRAAATYAMTSTEKLGTVLPCKVIGLPELAGIITDAPDHPTIAQLRAQGATIIQAREMEGHRVGSTREGAPDGRATSAGPA